MVDRWNPWTFTAPIAAKLETSSVRPITAYPVPPSHMQERQYVLEMAIRVACLWQHAWRAYANTRGVPMPIRVACLWQHAWRAYANTRGVPMPIRVACLAAPRPASSSIGQRDLPHIDYKLPPEHLP